MNIKTKTLIGGLTLIGASCNLTDSLLSVKTQSILKTIAGVTLASAAAIGACVVITNQD